MSWASELSLDRVPEAFDVNTIMVDRTNSLNLYSQSITPFGMKTDYQDSNQVSFSKSTKTSYRVNDSKNFNNGLLGALSVLTDQRMSENTPSQVRTAQTTLPSSTCSSSTSSISCTESFRERNSAFTSISESLDLQGFDQQISDMNVGFHPFIHHSMGMSQNIHQQRHPDLNFDHALGYDNEIFDYTGRAVQNMFDSTSSFPNGCFFPDQIASSDPSLHRSITEMNDLSSCGSLLASPPIMLKTSGQSMVHPHGTPRQVDEIIEPGVFVQPPIFHFPLHYYKPGEVTSMDSTSTMAGAIPKGVHAENGSSFDHDNYKDYDLRSEMSVRDHLETGVIHGDRDSKERLEMAIFHMSLERSSKQARNVPKGGSKVAARYVCAICNNSFTRKYSLKLHTRTHTGNKPLQCPHCDKNFSDPSNFTKHLRIHNGSAVSSSQSCACGLVLPKRKDFDSHVTTCTQRHSTLI